MAKSRRVKKTATGGRKTTGGEKPATAAKASSSSE